MKKTKDILIQYNQHIGYNFNSKFILLQGVEPRSSKSLWTNKKISQPLLEKEPTINKVSTIFEHFLISYHKLSVLFPHT